MMRPVRHGLRHHSAGSTTLEFALVTPPLLLLLLGILMSCLLYWSWQALEGAAIDAGRCAGLNAPNCGNPAISVTATQNYAVTAAQIRGLVISTANVTVLTGAPAQAACGNTTATVVNVQMTYTFPMIAYVPMPSNLTASACFPLAS
jgi:Flp pilus assembly protein TadG